MSQDPDTSDLVDELRSALATAGDPARAPQMQAYMRSTMPFRGIDAATVRRLTREVVARHPLPDRAGYEVMVRRLWDDAGYREERYAVIALTGHRLLRGHQDLAALGLYRHLVVTGAWWDLVDAIATNRVGPILRDDPVSVTPVIRRWAQDDDLWVRRTAILSQLKSRTATDTALLADVLTANLEDSLHGRQFFVRKAVGWALREHAKTDPDWVRTFVTTHESRLSGLTRREAMKHLRG